MSPLLQKLTRQRIDLEKRIKELEVSKVRHQQILIRLNNLSKSGSFNTLVKRVNELESIVREQVLDALKESRALEALVKEVNKLKAFESTHWRCITDQRTRIILLERRVDEEEMKTRSNPPSDSSAKPASDEASSQVSSEDSDGSNDEGADRTEPLM